MSTYKFVPKPKSASGGISDAQNVTLAGTAGTGSISVGKRQVVGVTVAAPVYVRFSLGASTAATTDMPLITGIWYEFDTGDEFDTLDFINNNGTNTTLVGVMRLNKG